MLTIRQTRCVDRRYRYADKLRASTAARGLSHLVTL